MNICWAVYIIFNVGNIAVNQHILGKAFLFIFWAFVLLFLVVFFKLEPMDFVRHCILKVVLSNYRIVNADDQTCP